MDYPTLTKTNHRTQYPAIDPTNPANSAAGKTVAISGGTGGIGYLIARGFAKAGASTIILLARRQEALDEGAARLRAEIAALPANGGGSTRAITTSVWTYLLDIRDTDASNTVFEAIRKRLNEQEQSGTGGEGTAAAAAAVPARDIDVLVANAARMDLQGVTAVEFDGDTLRGGFDTNVLGNLNLVRAFLTPEIPAIPMAPVVGEVKDTSSAVAPPPPPRREKIVLDVSSAAAQMVLPGQALYSATKVAFATMMRHLQSEVDRMPGAPVRIHSFHPGLILSPGTRKMGGPEGLPYDDESLPEGFAVWLASPAAAFLKGRFVWSMWDVEELVAMKPRFEEDPEFCQFTLKMG